MNYTFESLQAKVAEMITKLPGLVQKINLFKSTKLTDEQMIEFAYKAATLRTKAKVNTEELLVVERDADKGNDLWAVFNRVQEKLVNGGFHATSTFNQKRRKIRSIKSFVNDVKLNEQLWELAEQFVA